MLKKFSNFITGMIMFYIKLAVKAVETALIAVLNLIFND